VCQGFMEWLLWQLMFDVFGDLELSVQCVSSYGESTCYIVGTSGVSRTKGYWRI
jgi:hypothetical protein